MCIRDRSKSAPKHNKSQTATAQKGDNSGSQLNADSKKLKAKKGKHYCMLHGENNTHTTEQCKVLKTQADRMSATYKAQDPSNKKRRFENKVYDRRENEKKEQKKKETYAVIEAIVKKTLEGKTSNKRKVSEDLDGFNYDTLNELSLSDIEVGSDSDS